MYFSKIRQLHTNENKNILLEKELHPECIFVQVLTGSALNAITHCIDEDCNNTINKNQQL
jgi:hypothetical protein